MYNNSSHYPSTGYQGGYSQYPQTYSGTYGNYQGYTGYSSQNPQTIVPGQETFSSNNWSAGYNRSDPKDAVAQEMHQQKTQLILQREDYVKKASVLRHELEQLQMQKQDLVGNGRSPDLDLANILKQNDKLQDEIQGKLKAIHNVIEMLSSIIKDSKSITDLEAEFTQTEKPKPATPTSFKHQFDNPYKTHSPDEPKKNSVDSFCYVHYDTGLHWCRMCDEFPDTAKDFLLHLQDKKHREMSKENDVDSTPWHKLPSESLMPSDENAPKKRIPIKGLQFFISAPSWYCKLCDVWIGDLHCASQHLKSKTHHQNYENFVSQNPHWEMEWLKDREKSMARKGPQDSSDSDDARKKRKRKEKRVSTDLFSLKEKKKKKKSRRKRKHSSDSSSSSSSSDSSSDDENEDRSRSIRVAMRNMKQVQSIMDEDLTAKWSVLEKLVEEHKKKELKEKQEKEKRDEGETQDDPLINQWMTISQPPPKEKMMLDSLKDRMRQKQEVERARLAEMDKHRLEREREEAEKLERKKREEKEAAAQDERKRKLREQEELDRIRDKERNQVRFKTNSYRRRRSYSHSDEEDGNDQDRYYKRDGYRSSYRSRHSRSRSRSIERRHERQEETEKKKPGPPSYKKLPFIGRMPLFKNKAKAQEEKDEPKEIKKQSYEIPRRTRFEPGNLPKAFIPKPDVVCFPKLSSIPPLNIPPPAPVVIERVFVPEAPKISESDQDKYTPKPPPPPKLDKQEDKPANLSDDEVLYGSESVNPTSMMGQYYQSYGNSYIQNNYQYQHEENISPPPPPPHSHSMPLQPPPLPPDDDLALLGICADDMAAQSF